MTHKKYLMINRPQVISETFDDEVVLVNLDNGNYYSIDKVGADIWSFIESGDAVSDIVRGITQRYKGNLGDIESAIEQFVDELQQESLIVTAAINEISKTQMSKEQPETKPATEKLNFEPPLLQRYTDMQDLLLLDPIHEVDETGWPKKKPSVQNKDEKRGQSTSHQHPRPAKH